MRNKLLGSGGYFVIIASILLAFHIVDKLRYKYKFGFIKRVDKCRITTVKDLESWRFER
mgnify:CR=1 FL=1